jgi:hypothetical protein
MEADPHVGHQIYSWARVGNNNAIEFPNGHIQLPLPEAVHQMIEGSVRHLKSQETSGMAHQDEPLPRGLLLGGDQTRPLSQSEGHIFLSYANHTQAHMRRALDLGSDR